MTKRVGCAYSCLLRLLYSEGPFKSYAISGPQDWCLVFDWCFGKALIKVNLHKMKLKSTTCLVDCFSVKSYMWRSSLNNWNVGDLVINQVAITKQVKFSKKYKPGIRIMQKQVILNQEINFGKLSYLKEFKSAFPKIWVSKHRLILSLEKNAFITFIVWKATL